MSLLDNEAAVNGESVGGYIAAVAAIELIISNDSSWPMANLQRRI